VAAALENLPVLALIDDDEISIPATESAGEPRKTGSRTPPNAAGSVLVGEPTGFILHGPSGDRKHLSNFLARIARQEIHDDGATEQRFYHIVATRQRQDAARNMIRVEEEQRLVVPAREFEDMSWVPDKLGANFQIFIPGRRGRDLVAKAILFASGRGEVPTTPCTDIPAGDR
jgi:hypothetical protein